MQRILPYLFLLFLGGAPLLHAQTILFEELLTDTDTFLNGIDGQTAFNVKGATFNTRYDTSFGGFWAGGWAISTMRDSVTSGFTNLYSSITGGGDDGSSTYAVGNPPFGSGGNFITFEDSVFMVDAAVTNNTYAHNSMRDGDMFAKAFGGDSGNDEDFFLLTIKGFINGVQRPDTVDVYLADYRFDDNAMDFILDSWQTIDLSPLGFVDSLQFSLTSSDAGPNGINTPAFFCIDNINFNIIVNTLELPDPLPVAVFPTIAKDHLNIRSAKDFDILDYQVFDAVGRRVKSGRISLYGQLQIDLPNLPAGNYYLHMRSEEQTLTKPFIIR